VDEDKYINFLIEVNKEKNFVEEESQLTDPDSTYRLMMIQMLYYEVIILKILIITNKKIYSRDPLLVKIYRGLKKIANQMQPKLKKDWYKYYVVINYYEIVDKIKVLPDVELKHKIFIKNVEKLYQEYHPHPVNPLRTEIKIYNIFISSRLELL
jgi:hypothetical protein